MAAPSGPAANQSRTIAIAAMGTAAIALAVALFAAVSAGPTPTTGLTPSVPLAQAAASLAMATCTGSVAESPDQDPFVITLDHCDKSIDDIDAKTGFLTKWTICGGAKSFNISVQPRAVTVTSDAFNCSTIPSEVTVTYVGPLKK